MPKNRGRTSTEAKTEALARQFEGKARDALATLEKLGDTDWKKVTAAEKWDGGNDLEPPRRCRAIAE
jgi:hypothetical protein